MVRMGAPVANQGIEGDQSNHDTFQAGNGVHKWHTNTLNFDSI